MVTARTIATREFVFIFKYTSICICTCKWMLTEKCTPYLGLARFYGPYKLQLVKY